MEWFHEATLAYIKNQGIVELSTLCLKPYVNFLNVSPKVGATLRKTWDQGYYTSFSPLNICMNYHAQLILAVNQPWYNCMYLTKCGGCILSRDNCQTGCGQSKVNLLNWPSSENLDNLCWSLIKQVVFCGRAQAMKCLQLKTDLALSWTTHSCNKHWWNAVWYSRCDSDNKDTPTGSKINLKGEWKMGSNPSYTLKGFKHNDYSNNTKQLTWLLCHNSAFQRWQSNQVYPNQIPVDDSDLRQARCPNDRQKQVFLWSLLNMEVWKTEYQYFIFDLALTSCR